MRTFFAAIFAVLLVSSAFAQSPSDKVSLTITRGELQIIGQGIMELPYKTAAPVMQSLQRELAASDKAAADAIAAKAKDDADAKAAADAKAKAEKPVDAMPQTPAGVTPN